MRYEKRLYALEVRHAARRAPASALLDALRGALTEAIRAKITRRLDGMDDTPEQAAELAGLCDQWRAVGGHTEDTGARARIAQRLEAMAARQQAYAGVEDRLD